MNRKQRRSLKIPSEEEILAKRFCDELIRIFNKFFKGV